VDEPSQRLPKEARSYWRARWALQGGAALVVTMSFAGSLGGLAWLALAAVAVATVVAVAVVPELRWRRWRYEVREEEIDLQHGAFVMRRTLIPIRRVQHVDTESGVLRNSFGLTTVTFHTAAGGVSIPALFRGEAEAVRARVAELTRTRDDV
jgi:hypothetical protein